MFFDVTIQVRVDDFNEGQKWYQTLFKRQPDLIPHEDFAEWEVIPGCWIQVAKGNPAKGSGPIRLGVKDIEEERERLLQDLAIAPFEIYSKEGVPVKWGTFQDSWGNFIGLYEYLDKEAEKERIKQLLGNK
ncbi:MAG TPA: VOC family protein [Ureibacillus sp.]|nr:VOC family protein [Ureibacillus sp.]